MTRVYYKQATAVACPCTRTMARWAHTAVAQACVIIFDITRAATFQEVVRWKEDLDRKARLPNGELLPCLLIANKARAPHGPIPRVSSAHTPPIV